MRKQGTDLKLFRVFVTMALFSPPPPQQRLLLTTEFTSVP